MKTSTRIVVSVSLLLFLSVGLSYARSPAQESYISGLNYAIEGKYEEAKVEFEKGLKIDEFYTPARAGLEIVEDAINRTIKKETVVHLFKGAVYRIKLEKTEEAIAELNKAVELNPGYAHAYNYRGIALALHKGEYDLALVDLNKAIELNPGYTDAYNNRGIVYQGIVYAMGYDVYNVEGLSVQEGKALYDKKAIADFSKVIELNPGDIKTYLNRGQAYSKNTQYDRAIAYFNKLIELNPGHVEAYLNRGQAYGGNDQYDLAGADFSKTVELDPTNAEAYFYRAVIHYYKKEYDRAWEDVHKAQSLGMEVRPGFLEALNKASQ